jgi:NDP-sugar pyrophosphorylase family protein
MRPLTARRPKPMLPVGDEPLVAHTAEAAIRAGESIAFVVGDGAKTGIDTSLNAGVKLGADARTDPGETVIRDTDTEY